MSAYYNDFEPAACAWLAELMAAGLIAPGVIDSRSILEVRPEDLRGFTQCHFFAGIGGWSCALRLAGWPDARPVWTGSPPCQPFSAAGAQKGKDDERHLAPHFADLVAACRPGVLFGEQVASAAVFGKAAKRARKRAAGAPEWAWLDDLCDRLEAAHYAVGASDIPAAGVGAPHIRQRTFFGAVRLEVLEHAPGDGWGERRAEPGGRGAPGGCGAERLADADGRNARAEREQPGGEQRQQPEDGGTGGLADAECKRTLGGTPGEERPTGPRSEHAGQLLSPVGAPGRDSDPRALDGFWGDADWLYCRDGKWRPVEPGTFPLAHGVPGRVGLLRGYGNAINPWAAKVFIEAFEEARAAERLRLMSGLTGDVFG